MRQSVTIREKVRNCAEKCKSLRKKKRNGFHGTKKKQLNHKWLALHLPTLVQLQL